MYRFKYYYTDGTNEISGARSKKPENLYFDFDGLMDWNLYDELPSKHLTTREVLEYAMEVYKGFLKEFYRIEIINDETNEIVDFIEDRSIRR